MSNVFFLLFADIVKSTKSFDFVFLFTCREINVLLKNIKTVEDLLRHKYPEVFDTINISDLESISDRVLIIVDGLDELQDIYELNKEKSFNLISSLIDTRKGILKNHKVIACGRPKACEFVKQKFVQFSKTIEVVGFNQDNILKYVDKFFVGEEEKAKKVKEALEISNNLELMSAVPVFLWVICCVYGEELITKPLNTYTELYTYTTLIFLRNHFRGKLSQRNISLFEILEDDEIMNSVYALMSLSVQTYMENKVLFKEKDIKHFISPTELEKTGFIVRYKIDNLHKPVFQFNHLVLHEFFCSLSLCVTKWVSPHINNKELSSCTPVIFGIQRLLKEGDNELFVSFFNKLSSLYQSKMGYFGKFVLTPYRYRAFKRFLKKNHIEIPECMVKDDKLVIDTSLPMCQEFMTLLYESKIKLECPLTSCVIERVGNEIDYRNTLFLLKTLKLKAEFPNEVIKENNGYYNIHISPEMVGRLINDGITFFNCSIVSSIVTHLLLGSDYERTLILLQSLKLKISISSEMINGDTIIIDEKSTILGRFFTDGIEIENCPPVTSAVVTKYLTGENYKYTLQLLRYLKLKKIKISESMIDGDTIVIDEISCNLGRFLNDDIEIENCQAITSATVTRYLTEQKYIHTLQLLKYLKLKIKLPERTATDGKWFIDNETPILKKFLNDGIEIFCKKY